MRACLLCPQHPACGGNGVINQGFESISHHIFCRATATSEMGERGAYWRRGQEAQSLACEGSPCPSLYLFILVGNRKLVSTEPLFSWEKKLQHVRWVREEKEGNQDICVPSKPTGE